MIDAAATKHAFISYAPVDGRNIDRLQRMLAAAGISVWRDTEDLWPGEDWRARIRREIVDNSLAFIACFSQASMSESRNYHNEEILLAIEQLRLRPPGEIWLIPVRFDDCQLPELDLGAGRTLSSLRSSDLFGEQFYEDAARLIATILRLLTSRSAAAASFVSKKNPLPDDAAKQRQVGQYEIELSPDDRQRLLAELTRVFGEVRHAQSLLEQIGFPLKMMPAFDSQPPGQSWAEVFTEFDSGVIASPYRQVLDVARSIYPFNKVFDPLAQWYLTAGSLSPASKGRGSAYHESRDQGSLELAIGPAARPGQYQVEVLGSHGKTSAMVRLAMDELRVRNRELRAAMPATARPEAADLGQRQGLARAMGEATFGALLGANNVLEAYRASTALAAAREQSLPILLRLGTSELAHLPWESMYDSATGFLCLHHPLVRSVPGRSHWSPQAMPKPLRILVVTPAPESSADGNHARDLFSQAMAGPVAEGRIELNWLAAPTRSALRAALTAGDWHVLHVIGQAGGAARHDDGVVVLKDDNGHNSMIGASELARLLAHRPPGRWLVALASTSRAAENATGIGYDAALHLARVGSFAVITMQYPIGDAARTAFDQAVYVAAAQGLEVADAVTAGRKAIAQTARDGTEWLAPVLYVNADHAQPVE